MIVNDSSECSACSLGPPPDMILRLPPPPLPSFLLPGPDFFGPASGAAEAPGSSEHHYNGSPCRHSCEWRAEGVQYVEMPQQGTLFDDTWLIVLISACVGIVFIGIILATFMFKCKMEHEVAQPNDDASQCSNRSNKNSTLSTSTASSGAQTTTTSGGPCGRACGGPPHRLPVPEAVLYPCVGGGHQPDPALVHDPRVMWATLTPRGTTRHYLEEHTYETIGGEQPANAAPPPPPPPPPLAATPPPPPHDGLALHASSPSLHLGLPAYHHRPILSHDGPHEHNYAEPPGPPPALMRPKSEKAFDNTAFVDYEEPLTMKSSEYYQLDDVLEPCEPSKYGPAASGAELHNPARLPVFSVQGLYGMHPRASCTLRPRVSSPTRIEHPNLPPLNLQPTLPRRHRQRKSSFGQQHQHHHHHQHHLHHPEQQQQKQPQQPQHAPDCTLLRSGRASSAYIPTI